MKGVRELVYQLARARTREYGNEVLRQIREKSVVANYLKERRSEIEAAAFLERGFSRGGRITSQFRRLGFISGIIWMAEKFCNVQFREREFLVKWEDSAYKGRRLKEVSKKASDLFCDKVLGKGLHSTSFVSQSSLELKARVLNKVDETERFVSVSRSNMDATIVIDCSCLFQNEYGLPCACACQTLLDAKWRVEGLPSIALLSSCGSRHGKTEFH